MKIKIFSDHEPSKVEKAVNNFLSKHAPIKKIAFSTSLKDMDEMVNGNDEKLFYSVMIVYDD
ncbi:MULTISPECIES: hypothetical protein [unclassified Sporolactobacillus]|uniref:hypothetical protein n=1 Tax=unclassified Sporolactobacillus TaxID=2628533 RepID=UPI002367EB0C|nr:hypothetical protein [Sporolactobacillus sp. CQH2019]MDD9149133.1 hypothetical protein [Sporolactobacillus sp. CQH2019]